ncbi:MAG: glycosyltransferase family 39 protein [Chloroflexi bacterium]|nr:glycosyltransferase family 39 protein [Chloroflexota bacterium]
MALFVAMKRGHSRFLLLAAVLLAFFWRTARLDFQSLWRDEVDAIYFAVRPLAETLAMFVQAAQNGPLYFLGLRPWFAVAGTSEFALRLPSAGAGLLSVLLLWQLGRQLLPPVSSTVQRGSPAWGSVAGVAALLFVLNPYQLWYAQEGKMYATVTLLALGAHWLWLRGIQQGGWRTWLGYWAVVSLALYVHLLMVLLIPLHLVWFVIAWPTARLRWRGYGLALAGLTLPYVPMVWWHWVMLTSPDKLSGFNFTPLATILRALALSHVRGFITATPLLWLAPIYFLLGAGMLFGSTVVGDRRSEFTAPISPRRRMALLLTWLLLPVALIYLISLRQPVFTERYILWIGPAMLLCIAAGVQVLAAHSGRLALPVVAALLIYVVGLWGWLGWQQKTQVIKYDLRGAMQAVYQQRALDELLILQIPHQEWAYRYYTSQFEPDPFAGSDLRLGRWGGGPYTNWGHAEEVAWPEVQQYMGSLTAGADEIWVLLSEAPMWDSRQLMQRWLQESGVLIEQQSFAGVSVLRYRLNP